MSETSLSPALKLLFNPWVTIMFAIVGVGVGLAALRETRVESDATRANVVNVDRLQKIDHDLNQLSAAVQGLSSAERELVGLRADVNDLRSKQEALMTAMDRLSKQLAEAEQREKASARGDHIKH